MEVKTTIVNPFWEELQKWPCDEIEWKYRKIWRPAFHSVPYDRLVEAYRTGQVLRRDDMCIKYAWSIPDPASLELVAQALGEKAIEIGAGTGYWASLLAQMGIDMLCYDMDPPQLAGTNHWHSPRKKDDSGLTGEIREIYYDVRKGGTEKVGEYPDRTLFLCWPPYGSDMACKALQTYQGKRLIYIGEGDGGCTADEDFFQLLESEWHLVDRHIPVQWSGIHDEIEVYERGKEE